MTIFFKKSLIAALAIALIALPYCVAPQPVAAATTDQQCVNILGPNNVSDGANGCKCATGYQNDASGQCVPATEAGDKNPTGIATGGPNGYDTNEAAGNHHGSCSWTNPLSLACISDVVFWIPGYITSYMVLPAMSLLVYLSGMMLNWSMEYSVVHMSLHFQETGIDYIWTVIRDLANMGFIFMLIYTAIMTMFNSKDWQRTIVNIVLAAILINFSLLATKAVIDMSNVLAMLFYNAITPGGTTTTTGIASGFMQVLNLQSLYDISGASGTKLAIVGAAGSIVYLIASFSFLAVAIMFVIRFVTLVFVIALSPIYAISKVLPGAAGKYSDAWLKALLNQSFFAPVYFALTWVALKVAQGLMTGFMGSATNGVHGFSAALLGSGGTASQTLKADPNAVGIFIMFAIIIGLIMAALIVAKNIASQSHPMMKSITQKALGVAGGATLGAVGSIGRNTLGRAGAILGDDDKLKERAAAGSISARLQLAAGRKASESSFDFRGLGIAKPLDAGKVGKNAQGGFKKVNEEAAKEEAKRAKSYMANKDIVDADKKEREAARDAAKEALDARTKEAIAAAKTAHPDAEKSQELLDAEEGEIRAQEGVRSTANDAQKQVWTDRLNKAKTQADTLRTEHAEKQQAIEASRKEFVERETAAATKTHSNAADRAKRTINDDRADAAVADAKGGNWKTKAAINTFGRIPGVNPFFNKLVNLTNEAKAAEIRKQTKKKSTKDEAVEAMKKLAKEDEEEEKKDKPPEEKAEGEKGEEKKDA